jgi:hypothetical protein
MTAVIAAAALTTAIGSASPLPVSSVRVEEAASAAL